MYYDYHRCYDPSIGRFISQDPKPGNLANPQGLNLYVYVRNCPCTLTDPSGEGFLDSIGTFLSTIVKSVTNTINQLGSAAITLTTKVASAVATATISTAKTLVTASEQLAKGVLLGQTMGNALVGPVIMGTTLTGQSTSGKGGGSGGENPLDTINGLADIFTPCQQVIIGTILVGSAPFLFYATLVAMGGTAVVDGGASLVGLAAVLAAGDELTWQPIVGAYLLARGSERGGCPVTTTQPHDIGNHRG